MTQKHPFYVPGGHVNLQTWISVGERKLVCIEDWYFTEEVTDFEPDTLAAYLERNLRRWAIQQTREEALPHFINVGPFYDPGNDCKYRITWGDNPDEIPALMPHRKPKHLGCIRAEATDGRYSVAADIDWLRFRLPQEWRVRCIKVNDLCRSRQIPRQWNTPLLADLTPEEWDIYLKAIKG